MLMSYKSFFVWFFIEGNDAALNSFVFFQSQQIHFHFPLQDTAADRMVLFSSQDVSLVLKRHQNRFHWLLFDCCKFIQHLKHMSH